jgi:hypothetical protein
MQPAACRSAATRYSGVSYSSDQSPIPAMLHGLISRPEIDGRLAVIIGAFDSERGRWPVRILKVKRTEVNELVLVKPSNLLPLGIYKALSNASLMNAIGMVSTGKCRSGESDHKISKNAEQPYRIYCGDPFLSFSGVGTFSENLVQLHRYCHSTACPLRAGVSSAQSLAAAFKGTKLQSCSNCRNSWFCSTKCQQHDWVHGDHRARCAEIRVTLGFGQNQHETNPAQAYRGFKSPEQMVSSKRIAKNFSAMTFEEKCTMEFLYSCGILQTIMSDTFHRRANFLPPSDTPVFSFEVPVHTKSKVRGMENVTVWEVVARKFKCWMWQCLLFLRSCRP